MEFKQRKIKFRFWHIPTKTMWLPNATLSHILIGHDGSVKDIGENRDITKEVIKLQFTGLLDKEGKEIYELMEINHKYWIVYKFNRYVLQDISNRDIFAEILENEKYEITGEYFQI